MSDALLPRRGWRMWAAALGGGTAVSGAMALFALMVTAPDRHLADLDSRSDAAATVLKMLIRGETPPGRRETEDAITRYRDLDPFHAYRTMTFGSARIIVARGNLDGDPAIDDWQISSTDLEAIHLYDDARNTWTNPVLTDVYGLANDGRENPDLPLKDRARLPAAMRAYQRSRQAKVVLEDLALGESRYHAARHEWLLFEDLTPHVWGTLSQSTSGALAYRVRAATSGTSILLTAVGDIDGDPCLDVWATRPGDLVPEHLQDDVVLDECPNGISR